MKKPYLIALTTLSLCLTLFGCASKYPQTFKWSESTIDEMHLASQTGDITCHQIIKGYIKRIHAFDINDPAFNSIITLNPNALALAAALDKQKKKNAPLWCVPIVVKDNINTKDMPTSLGLKILKSSRPPEDAQVVKNLRKQGAIILGKTNLDELAIAMLGLSSAGGQTKNVFIPTNGPGGSSGGTASAVSASLAMVGLGTDTGGSIRIPSALAGLTGIRPTRKLAELNGIAPLSNTQDTVGPMCRKVKDCASILRFTEANSTPKRKKTIMDALEDPGLKGARIAMVTKMFPPRTAENYKYWDVMDRAFIAMHRAGAIIDEVELPAQDDILNKFISLSRYEIVDGIDEYLQSWSSDNDGHLRSYAEILNSKGYSPQLEQWLILYQKKSKERDNDPEWKKNTEGREEFVRKKINEVMDGKTHYDALLYPTLTQLNVPIGNNTEGRKNVSLSAFSGLPSISFIAGMTDDKEAQPIALEFLGREYAEPKLIALVQGYETINPIRTSLLLAPEIP